VLPITSPPLRDGWIDVQDGEVIALGGEPATGPGGGAPPALGAVTGVSARGRMEPRSSMHAGAATPASAPAVAAGSSTLVEEIDLGRVAVMPGLVNAHTHIELSWMWGRVPPNPSFVDWVSQLMALRAAAGGDDRSKMIEAIAGAEEAGTAAIGDISNTLASVDAIARSRLHAVVFRELLGFRSPDPAGIVHRALAEMDAVVVPPDARIRLTLAPHAPYSVSPALFREIAKASTGQGALSSVHLGESPEEVRFLKEGEGPFRAFLERVGAWTPAWEVPRCGPAEYLRRLDVLSPRLLVVHGVQLTDEELADLAGRGATLVTCPRSNVWVGAGDPPIERFYASGLRIAIGTDSLASATDLNLFSEVAAMHALAPGLAPARLLASATRVGAEALGFDRLGFIGPGARARLIAIDLPEHVRDVETYLCEGVDPGQIDWLPVED
jgi:cytosine/adenosine deaminase-related metal-dependent hydrolase